ncbi:phosphoenolpyruvate synthase [Oscillatoriales cyanobacterium USR001]|nr:phosphoenolpyruvate synthase [Oscillatoriales cyanobacterium USR001]
MQNLYWLNQVQTSDREAVGDRAFYLSELMQRGYPVVEGFVVTAKTFWEFLSVIDWREPLFADLPHSSLYFNADNPWQLQAIAQRIRQQLLTAKLPEAFAANLQSAVQKLNTKTVIFRPSLNNPKIKTSGLLESQIAWTDSDSIAIAIKQTWAEFFRAKSLFYWQRCGQKLEQLVPIILVQSIWNAPASGTIRTGNKSHQIQANWGLETSLIWGEAMPDYYQVETQTRNIQSQQLGNKSIAYYLANDPSDTETKPNSHLIFPQAHKASFIFKNTTSPLQIRVLTEIEQNQYVLDKPEIEKVIELGEKAQIDLNFSVILDWTLCQLNPNAEPEFYITEVAILNSEIKDDRVSTNLSFPASYCIQGLAAAAGTTIAIAQVITNPNPKLSNFLAGGILVAPAISPEWLRWLKVANGVVAEQGGMTGHGAILARELGIPAVVGVTNATRLIKTGDLLLVDGNKGEIRLINQVAINDIPSTQISINKEQSAQLSSTQYKSLNIDSNIDFSYMSKSQLPIATKLCVNVSQTSSIEQIKNLPIDGIGLLRSELMALEALEYKHPSLWLQEDRQSEFITRMTRHLTKFAVALAPRPVFYRSFDLRESGVKSSFSYALEPNLFDLELTVIEQLHRSGNTNVNLILPFVRSVADITFCGKRLAKVRDNLHSDFQLWIMAEVPSVLFLLSDYVKAGVQGIAIGTNDLTQLLLGVDRDSEQMTLAFNERNPAVMRALKQLIEMANAAGIPCSICGDAPALYPEIIDSLIRWGITSISVNLDAVERTLIAIARAEQRLILETARNQLQLFKGVL